jgi:LPXTG-motif cell wall-anchored protein
MISKSRQISHGCLAMALVLLLSVILSITASADETSLAAQTTSLTVIYQVGDEGIANAPFQLYRVAKGTESGEIDMEQAFEPASVDLDEEGTADSWSAGASTLEGYLVELEAEGDPVVPTAEAITNENGVAVFRELPEGLYLLVGDQTMVEQTIYTPMAMLISLTEDSNENFFDEGVTVYVKGSSRTVDGTTTDLSVLKVWKDEGHEDERPAQVTVTLYAEDEAVETVTLSAENNWSYTWTELDDSVRWYLSETDIPEGYTVTTVQDGTTFVVTNTYAEETPAPSTTPTPTTTTTTKLPQTGQLWWPITLLAICGLAVILLGLGLRKRGSDHHEAK